MIIYVKKGVSIGGLCVPRLPDFFWRLLVSDDESNLWVSSVPQCFPGWKQRAEVRHKTTFSRELFILEK